MIVKLARTLQQTLNNDKARIEPINEELDDMVLKAFKMVLRAVQFYDIWQEDVAFEQDNHNDASTCDGSHDGSSNTVPPTPPADEISFNSVGKAVGGIDTVTRRTSSAIREDLCMRNSREHTNNRPGCHRTSKSYNQSRTLQTFPPAARPLSVQVKRQSISHRVSYSVQSPGLRSGSLASEKLDATHGAFLGYLGSFIGLHLPSRTSTDVLITTQQAVNACRAFLTVVDGVWDRDFRRSTPLELARDDMYTRITDLVATARDIFQPSNSSSTEILIADDGKKLVDAATSCIRGAGECMAKTRFVLETIGDFEFETIGLGISAFGDCETQSTTTSSHSDLLEEQHALDQPQSVPPQPTHEPPPPPPCRGTRGLEPIQTTTPQQSRQCEGIDDENTSSSRRTSAYSLLPPLPVLTSPLLRPGDFSPSSQTSTDTTSSVQSHNSSNCRTGSIGVSSNISGSTYIGSMRDSERSMLSATSTRAESLDLSSARQDGVHKDGAFSGNECPADEDVEELETKLLTKTFAHELTFSKEGQITGGTLPALVERLTTHDSTPDALFVSAFYLTFRLFTTPQGFAQSLIDRFEYMSDSTDAIAGVVRLRVFNVFKGWLESHWRMDCDKPALDMIVAFAKNQLASAIPSAAKFMLELTNKVSNVNSPLVPRLISSIGKTNTSVANYVAPDTPMPAPIITKSQLNALRNWRATGHKLSILDFDALELARQFTIKESRIFCSILPEELLATEWTKKSGSLAVNVRAMSTLSNDLASLVSDSILQHEDPTKRAKIIKRWVKIATKCLELHNYDSLMAILATLNSTNILRMKKTWDALPAKTKAGFENLKSIVAISRNYRTLRHRLQSIVSPCIPFLGIHLTDLTFVDVGNPPTRQLPCPGSAAAGGDSDATISVINFHKHIMTAHIISELQRFQIPYRLQEVPELQTWMQDQLVRVRSSADADVQNAYRRSLLLEPREIAGSVSGKSAKHGKEGSRDKIELFPFAWGREKEKERSGAVGAVAAMSFV